MKVNESIILNKQLFALVQASINMFNASVTLNVDINEQQEEALSNQLKEVAGKLWRVNNNLARLAGMEPLDLEDELNKLGNE